MITHAGKARKTNRVLETDHRKDPIVDSKTNFRFEDKRPVALAQRCIQATANTSQQVSQLKYFSESTNTSSITERTPSIQAAIDNHHSHQQNQITQKENKTGLPDTLKSGIESLSGISLDDVQVHRNSSNPAQLQAHAYAQGTDIHLGPGQEKHLPHETWHVVQQKQGRVKPTKKVNQSVYVNDDSSLEKEADNYGAMGLQLSRSTENDVAPQSINAYPQSTLNESVVQRTVWMLSKGEWIRYADGTDQSPPPSDTNSFAEGQIVDTSPKVEKSKRTIRESKKPKRDPDPFITQLGLTPSGASALVVGVYMSNEWSDRSTLKEQDQQQKAINTVYSDMGVHVHKLKTNNGGNKFNFTDQAESDHTDNDDAGQDEYRSDVESDRDWRRQCVLILNAHGNVDWFFGNSPGNEVAAVRGVSKWIRQLESEKKMAFDAVILESCHSGEELMFGPNTDHHRFQQCPARLLSYALAHVRVVGFNGNTVTQHRQILMADESGKQIEQKYASNAVVFLGGEVIKGTVSDSPGVHHTYANINEKHPYYADLFTAYRASYNNSDQSGKTYLSHSFTDQEGDRVEKKNTNFDFTKHGKRPAQHFYDNLEHYAEKKFFQLMEQHSFSKFSARQCSLDLKKHLLAAKHTFNSLEPDQRIYFFDKALKQFDSYISIDNKKWKKRFAADKLVGGNTNTTRDLAPIDEKTYADTIKQIRETSPDLVAQANVNGQIYEGYKLSNNQIAHLNGAKLLPTVPDGDCSITAVLQSLQIESSARVLTRIRARMANSERFSNAQAAEVLQPGDWAHSNQMLDVLAEILQVRIIIVPTNGQAQPAIGDANARAVTIYHVKSKANTGHFYGSQK